MKREDVNGNNGKRTAREQVLAWRELDPPQIEWDESEVCAIVDDMVARPRFDD